MNDIEIVNTALQNRLGQSPITDFNNNNLISRQSYVQVRNSLLREIPWNFARHWANLAQLQAVPLSLSFSPQSAAPGKIIYTTAYALPTDYLRLYRFSPHTAHWRIVGKAVYTDAVAATVTGPLLGLQPIGSNGTDNQPPSIAHAIGDDVGIEYIRVIENPEDFDPLFTEAFIWKLVLVLSFGVTGLTSRYEMADNKYKECMMNASAVNGMENWPDEFYNTQLTDVRYGYSGVGIQGL